MDAMLNAFTTREGVLHAEGVSVEALAKAHGTPLYIYSLGHVLENYRRLSAAFAGLDHAVCFSMKANANLGILSALAREGCGFDIVSGGELHRVLRAGADPAKVIFAGVGKTDAEMEYAIRSGIYMFNIESWPEAEALNRATGRLGRKVKADFRINPDVQAGAHKKISTAHKASKFGLPWHETLDLFTRARRLRHLDVTGIHLHIGSQITELAPFVAAAKRALELVGRLRAAGFGVRTLNMGGGLGIVYNREKAKSPEQYAAALRPLFEGSGLKLIFEPGRYFVGNAGILVTGVVHVKETRWKDFVVVDAAMNDLIRPSLYEAYHGIIPVKPARGRKLATVDVVGPICESGDFLAQDRQLPLPKAGERLAVLSAGAYGMVMASNYNQRGRAAEVLVQGKQAWVTRQRETWDDLLRGESIPAPLKAKPGKRG
jgi:diaminopimelate decarboxylase